MKISNYVALGAVSLFTLFYFSWSPSEEPAQPVLSSSLMLTASLDFIEGNECFGETEGNFEIIADNGTPPYSFSLNGGAPQDNGFFEDLGNGNYTVVVSDATGQSVTVDNLIIDSPAELIITANVSGDDVSVTATGGTAPYEYSLDGANFQSLGQFNNLNNGTYTVTVEDINGCSEGESFEINVLPVTASAQITQNLACFGDVNAIITASASQGFPPYFYSLNGGGFQSSGQFSGLGAGTYVITVSDSENNTFDIDPINIDNPTMLIVNATVTDNDVVLGGSGGTGSLQYSVDGQNFQSTNFFENLPNGMYTGFVQDANGCETTTDFAIDFDDLAASANINPVSCHDLDDGSISITASGGTPPYTYSLNGGTPQSSNIFSGLSGGSYNVNINDSGNLSFELSNLMVINPDELSLNLSVNDNEITASASGGTGNLQYSIDGSNFQNSNIFSNLSNGTYTVTVRDENGCETSSDANVAVNTLVISAIATDITCHDENDGTITVSVSGGTPNFQYSLNGGSFQSSSTFENLSSGNYSVEVQDSEGFTQTTNTVIISNPPALMLMLSVNMDEITAAGTGGTGNLQYNIDGGSFQNSNIFSNLDNGTYTITVRDENGCETSSDASVAVNTLVVSASSTDITCHDENDGTLTVTVSGGTPNFQYSLNGGAFQDSNIFENLSAGNYSVEVQDSEGFTQTTNTVNISNPPSLMLMLSVNEDEITASGSGGTGNLMYSINGVDFQTGNTFSNLANGAYTITLQDANNCTTAENALVAVNSLVVAASAENISCFGENDGIINVDIAGGTPPYQYSINGSDFQDEGQFTGLGIGSYTVTVQDSEGFSQSSNIVNISQPEVISLTINVNEDQITAEAQGGTGSLEYSLNGTDYQSSNVFNDTPNGSYTITVRDENGCTQSAEATVAVNTLVVSATGINITCHDDNDGEISVSVSGGTPPIQYSLNGTDFQTSGIFQGLSGGSYTVTVQDAEGFTQTTNTVDIINPADLELNTEITENTINASASGGTGAISYSINGIDFQNSGTFTDLANGTYTLTARDENDCTVSVEIIIAVNTLSVSATGTDISCFDENDGSILVTVAGGTAPFQYSLNGGAFQNSNTFENLEAGNYIITVIDVEGFAMETNSVSIANPSEIVLEVSVLDDDITITASGGTGTLEYSINGVDFQQSNIFADLENGVYTVLVRDSDGCTVSATAIVAVNTLIISTENENVSCFGESDGSITVVVGGGMAPFTYSLNGDTPQDSPVFMNLPGGNYSVTVTDAEDFSQTLENIEITSPSAITADLDINLNSITVNAAGGTPPYTYSINGENFSDNNVFDNLSNGTYTLSIADANDCVFEIEGTVNLEIVATTEVTNEIACFGETGASISVAVTGGIEPYVYSLDNGPFQESNVFENLGAGEYEITIQDAVGNIIETNTITISEPEILSLDVNIDGTTANLNAAGGTEPYQYSLDGENFGSENVFADLEAGTYTAFVLDANGCTEEIDFTLSSVSFTSEILAEILCNGSATGSIELSAAGGNEPYQYSLDGGDTFQDSPLFEGLTAGTYLPVVVDANGNTSSSQTEIILNEPETLVLNVQITENNLNLSGSGGTEPYSFSIDEVNFQDSGEFQNLENGEYLVSIQDANGCITTTGIIIDFSSLFSPTEAASLKVFPNPNAGDFQVSWESPETGNISLEIFNVLGQKIHKIITVKDSRNFVQSFESLGLQAGVYQLRIGLGQRYLTEQFVVR